MSHYKRTLLASKLPDEVSAVELKTFFEAGGDIERILYRKKFPGSIFIVYNDAFSVGKAVSDLSSKKLKDTLLTLRSASSDVDDEISDLMTEADLLPLVTQLKALPKDHFDRLMSHFATGSGPTVQTIQHVHQSKLPTFSGDNQKGEVTYLQWRFHLKCLIQDTTITPSTILQSIRLSVRGTAADVLMYLGESCTPDQVLSKYDTIFGNALSSEQLLMQLFNAKQSSDESVVTWSCRLQQLFSQVKDKSTLGPGADSMLRAIFFHGLHNKDIISATRHRFESDDTYDELLSAVRKVEFELQASKDPHPSKEIKKVSQHQVAASSSTIERKLDQLLEAVSSLDKRVSQLEVQDRKNLFCLRCHRTGHEVSQCRATKDAFGNRLN